MKKIKPIILVVIVALLPFFGKSQKNYDPIYYSVGKLKARNCIPNVGGKFTFTQNCTKLIPTTIADDLVFFENNYLGNLKIQTSLSFKDTILVGLTYTIFGDKKEALKFLYLDTVTFQHLDKNTFHYAEQQGNTFIDCWILKKEIIYAKSAIKPEED